MVVVSVRKQLSFALSFATSLVASAMQNPADAGDQSEYAVTSQINTAHTGNVDFATGFAPPLTRIWTSDIGEGLVSYPLIAENKVFVNGNGYDIFALDLATGKQVWKHSLSGSQQGVYDRGSCSFSAAAAS